MNTITHKLRQFVVYQFLFAGDDSALSGQTSFLESGIIDSTGVLELIGYLHKEFGIEIDDDEITPDNLDSLDKLTQFVGRKITVEVQQQ